MSRYPFEKMMVLGAGVGRNLGDAGWPRRNCHNAARREGNNGVTFPIRRAALVDAIISANKHIKL